MKANPTRPDERGARRRHLMFNLSVHDAAHGGELGRLVDLTLDGLMLVSRSELPVDVEYALRVQLPAGLNESEVLNCRARSRHCGPDVSGQHFDIGFELIDLDAAAANTVRAWISRFSFD